MKTHTKLIAIVFASLANFATPASARSPQGRHITGIIRKVDASAREVEMLRENDRTPITFVWNRFTTFVAATSMADAAILKKGARVEVVRHTPFFGKPFVTKVTLLQTSNQTTKTK